MLTIEQVEGMRWLVVHTNARAEKKVAQFCQRLGIAHFLPLRRSVRRYHDRIVVHEVPIFQGYIFVQVDTQGRTRLEEISHVAHCIAPGPDMEAGLVRELISVQMMEKAAAEGDLVVRSEIEVGKRVIIGSGPMAGLTGVVIKRKNKTRVAVNVEMIGQSVSIEADVGELEIDC